MLAVFRYNAICPKGRALLRVLLSAERGEWTEGGDRPLCDMCWFWFSLLLQTLWEWTSAEAERKTEASVGSRTVHQAQDATERQGVESRLPLACKEGFGK